MPKSRNRQGAAEKERKRRIRADRAGQLKLVKLLRMRRAASRKMAT